MYIHVGNNHVIKSQDLIGIFDIEATSTSSDTRRFLSECAKRKNDVSCTDNFPRSFVVTFEKKDLDEKVYISRLSPSTLKGRCKSGNTI